MSFVAVHTVPPFKDIGNDISKLKIGSSLSLTLFKLVLSIHLVTVK